MLKDGITFSCDQDNYSTDHSYPRGDDPAHDTSLPIYIDGETLTAANASYNSLTGDISITIPGHGLSTTDQIRIENNSLTFTCSRDNNISVHNYPRPGIDPFAGRWLRIKSFTTDTFTVNVGQSPSDQQYTHEFVTALENGIVKKNNSITVNVGASPTKSYAPTAATYNSSTGAMELTIGSHSLPAPTTHTPTDVAYNPTTGIMTLTISGHGFSNGEKIKIADGGLKLSCAFGGASGTAAQKDYPRSTDPISNKWIPISNVTTDTFDVQVLDVVPSTNTDTHSFVSAVSGCVSKANSTLKVAPNSLLFSCTEGAGNYAYPRTQVARHTAGPGTTYNPATGIVEIKVSQDSHTPTAVTYDPTSGDMVLTIALNSGTKDVSGATYNPSTGDLVLDIGAHTLTTNDRIKLAEESLTFTCNYLGDGNQTQKKYPRASGASTTGNNGADYAFDTYLDITAVDQSGGTITVNINGGQGAITDISTHQFVEATSGAVILGHGFVVGDRIKIAEESLTFT